MQIRIAATIAALMATQSFAQLPNAPVLQNAWATPGIVAAANVGGSSDGSVYAGAVSWAPGTGRFQLSAGLGAASRKGFSSRTAYGVRVAVPFAGSSTFGFAAFAGIGGTTGSGVAVEDTLGIPLAADSIPWTTEIPIGVAIGWRHAIGASHGLSVYATPTFITYSGGSHNGNVFRAAIGADVGITSSIGATAGIDFGGTKPRGFGGPSSTQFGVGVSYAFGRR